MIERLDGYIAIHPAWRENLRALCARTGVYPGSTWRSRKLQARWHNCFLNGCRGLSGCHGSPGNCPGANPPGLSFHEYAETIHDGDRASLEIVGLAVADDSDGLLIPAALACDLSWDNDDQIRHAHEVAGEYDLHFPIYNENWHVQHTAVPQSRSPYEGWTPFLPILGYVHKPAPPDPWDDFAVVLAA